MSSPEQSYIFIVSSLRESQSYVAVSLYLQILENCGLAGWDVVDSKSDCILQ